jgi:hypothetical protein
MLRGCRLVIQEIQAGAAHARSEWLNFKDVTPENLAAAQTEPPIPFGYDIPG